MEKNSVLLSIYNGETPEPTPSESERRKSIQALLNIYNDLCKK